jgi:hypothetical protein
MAEETESKVIDEEDIDDDELDEGFLFGVENQVTKSLRTDVIAKNKENTRLRLAARAKDATILEKDAALQEKDAVIQRLRAEIERLKSR